MRIYCSFEQETISRATRQVVKTLMPVVMTSAEEFAEVVITDNLNTALKDAGQHFILVSSEKIQKVPDNVKVIKKPLQLLELLTILSQHAEKIDVNKKRVLIYDPHHDLADDKLLYDAVYNKHGRKDVDLHSTMSFDEYCKLIRSNTQYQLVLSDCFPSTGDFSRQAQERVCSEIRRLKSRADAPIVLIEQCEGYEKEALRIGADGVLSDWHCLTIAKVIDEHVPQETVQLEEIASEKLIGGRVMKILVVDDSPLHIEAAKRTLRGHNLTTTTRYDTALDLLKIQYDDELVEQKLLGAGLSTSSPDLERDDEGAITKESEASQRQWWGTRNRFHEESRLPYWDAVLVDLLMPAGQDAQGREGQKYVGQEMPVGFALALLAAKNGAKYVAVVTATNHHRHPASAMLDRLGSAYWQDDCKADFNINGTKAGFWHYPAIELEDQTCPKCEGTDDRCEVCNGKHPRAKDWGKVFEALLKE